MLLEYWGQGLTMGKVTWERKQVKAYEGSHSPGWWVTTPLRGTSQ